MDTPDISSEDRKTLLAEIGKEANAAQSRGETVTPERVDAYIQARTGGAIKGIADLIPSTPDASAGPQGVMAGLGDIAHLAKTAVNLRSPDLTTSTDAAKELGGGIAQMGKDALTTLGEPFLGGLPGGLPVSSLEDYQAAVLRTAGNAAMAAAPAAGPLVATAATLAGGAAQTPEDPLRGMTSAGVLTAAPHVAAKGLTVAAKALPSEVGNAMVRKAVGLVQGEGGARAGGQPALNRIAIDAAQMGKEKSVLPVHMSPELNALGEFALEHSPEARAAREQQIAGINAGQTERLAVDASKTTGGTHIAKEDLANYAQRRSQWAKGSEGYGGLGNPEVPTAEKFFNQPIVHEALRDAEKVGLIGEPIDPQSVARRQFQHEVETATAAQEAWDTKKNQALAVLQSEHPGALYGGSPSPTAMASIERSLGPRPEIPTVPPAPSLEMLQHIRGRLKAAIEAGYAPGSGKGDVAARLQTVLDNLTEHLKQSVEGFGDVHTQYGQRKGLEAAIEKPRGPAGRNPTRVPSADEIWKPGFNYQEVPGVVARLSREPVPGVGMSELDVFHDAVASHLQQDLGSGKLAASDLTRDALQKNPSLATKVRQAFDSDRAYSEFVNRATMEARTNTFKAPKPGAQTPMGANMWYSKYLTGKIAYKLGAGRYMKRMASSMEPQLFTPGTVRPRAPLSVKPSAGTNQAAALAAMLAARQGKPNAP